MSKELVTDEIPKKKKFHISDMDIMFDKELTRDENGIEKLEKYEEHNVKAPTREPKRKFIRIITTYYPDDLICYKEYKGKPYFSIEYQENEETIVGFGTYNPDVLSSYLRDYFFNER